MTPLQNIRNGVSKCAWGYLFLYFDVKLGTVSILPTFVAFWLYLDAIALLKEEERELNLLTSLGWMLLVCHGIGWIGSWFGLNIVGLIPGMNLIICVVNLYFHFQLVTNLASIARRYQPEGTAFDRKLLKYRSMQTILLTVMIALSELAILFGDFWGYVSIALGLVHVIAGILIMSALFSLKKALTAPTQIPEE